MKTLNLTLATALVLTFVTFGLEASAHQVLERGKKAVEIKVDGKTVKADEIQYVVVSVRATGVCNSDGHPSDPICEFDHYYYEEAAVPMIQRALAAGYREAMHFNVAPDDVTEGDVSEDHLTEGVLILYRGGDAVPSLTTRILQELANKYL